MLVLAGIRSCQDFIDCFPIGGLAKGFDGGSHFVVRVRRKAHVEVCLEEMWLVRLGPGDEVAFAFG
jgi:hypothetical protein